MLRPEAMRAWEAASLAPGAESDARMCRAGEAAARRILALVPAVRTAGAVIHAGRGNNGGDAWVVAGVLAE
ncbi:MAG: NAD(P)H-hydrate epimerase, partial [Gemmatimonadota bacterium]